MQSEENKTYIVMCANVAHVSGNLKFFLLVDGDENTVEFSSLEIAKQWCADNEHAFLAYTILCTDDFIYE